MGYCVHSMCYPDIQTCHTVVTEPSSFFITLPAILHRRCDPWEDRGTLTSRGVIRIRTGVLLPTDMRALNSSRNQSNPWWTRGIFHPLFPLFSYHLSTPLPWLLRVFQFNYLQSFTASRGPTEIRTPNLHLARVLLYQIGATGPKHGRAGQARVQPPCYLFYGGPFPQLVGVPGFEPGVASI